MRISGVGDEVLILAKPNKKEEKPAKHGGRVDGFKRSYKEKMEQICVCFNRVQFSIFFSRIAVSPSSPTR